MRLRRRFFILLYILIVLALGVLIYLVPGFRSAMTRTATVEYGTLSVQDEVVSYIVRDETVYAAGNSGNIGYYLEDGTALRGGAKVLTVENAYIPVSADRERPAASLKKSLGSAAVVSADYIAPHAGELCYYIDGLEGYFTPENISEIKYAELEDLDTSLKNLVRTNTLAGEPLYKIANEHKWYLIAWTAPENSAKYTVGKTMTLTLPKGDVNVTLTDIREDGEMWRLTFETNRYYEGYLGERKMNAVVTTAEISGILIENRSITTSEGVVGVYVHTKSGDFRFTPIKVLGSDGERSVCTMSYYYDDEGKRVNTVENYDEILVKPEAK